ncbi:hypothetical protein GX50_08987, partial [[Emmonsia] crescens]
VLKLKTVSTEYNPNAASLSPFSREEIEHLINPQDSDTDSFIIFPSSQIPAILPKQLTINEWHH